MEDDPWKHGRTVGRRHDARFEEGSVLAAEREHLAADVVARQHQERAAAEHVGGDAMRAEQAHSKHRAVRSRQDSRQRSLAPILEAVGELGREPAGGERIVPSRTHPILGLGRPPGIEEDVRRRNASRSATRAGAVLGSGGARQKLVVNC